MNEGNSLEICYNIMFIFIIMNTYCFILRTMFFKVRDCDMCCIHVIYSCVGLTSRPPAVIGIQCTTKLQIKKKFNKL